MTVRPPKHLIYCLFGHLDTQLVNLWWEVCTKNSAVRYEEFGQLRFGILWCCFKNMVFPSMASNLITYRRKPKITSLLCS